VLAKLGEVLFVETLRAYSSSSSRGQGWLAGPRDAKIGKTLTLMHRDPSRARTLATLAKEVGFRFGAG
jgi:hypothetical protein